MVRVIVVGGGLAGLFVAHTLLGRGANVILVDKQPVRYPHFQPLRFVDTALGPLGPLTLLFVVGC